jgi:hypothetical protein
MSVGTLTKLGGNLESPRDSKPSDYPAVGPSGPAGQAEGVDKLVVKSADPSEPSAFKVGKSSAEVGTSVKNEYSVNLNTGGHDCE